MHLGEIRSSASIKPLEKDRMERTISISKKKIEDTSVPQVLGRNSIRSILKYFSG